MNTPSKGFAYAYFPPGHQRQLPPAMEYLCAGQTAQEPSPAPEYLPAGHGVHPSPARPNCPAGHVMHEPMLVERFSCNEYVPAGQSVHGCPASAYLFGAQMSQLPDPIPASFPAAQVLQPSESSEYLLTEQYSQSSALSVRLLDNANFPSGQSVQASPSEEYLFAGHISQEPEPADEAVPAGHGVQPSPSRPNCPAGHAMHESTLY